MHLLSLFSHTIALLKVIVNVVHMAPKWCSKIVTLVQVTVFVRTIAVISN